MTTETRTADISSRFAREVTTAHWRCPAPDGDGGKCFRQIPCDVHSVDTPHIGMLLYGGSFFVPDSVEQSPTVEPIPEGWRSVGFMRDDELDAPAFGGQRPTLAVVDEVEAFVDEQLSKWFGVRVVVDPSMDREPGWALRGIDYRPRPWESGPAAYPHPEAARLAKIAPWLTFDADGRTLDHG